MSKGNTIIATGILLAYCCLGQSGFSTPSPFTQSSSQLIENSLELESHQSAFYADFDEFGNRQINARTDGITSRVDFEQDFTGKDSWADLGITYRTKHQPILPLNNNPYSLTPAIDILQRFGRFDILRPEVSLSVRHDSALQIPGSAQTTRDITNELSTGLIIQTAKDRVGKSTTTMGYNPTMRRYVENPGLDATDHAAFVTMAMFHQHLDLAIAATYAKSTTPSLLLGAGTTSTTFSQTLRATWNLSEKLNLTTAINNSAGTQTSSLALPVGQSATQNQESSSRGISTALSIIKNEKLSIAPTIRYTVNSQPVRGIGLTRFGGKTTVLNPFVQMTIIASEKFEVAVGGGVTISKGDGRSKSDSGASYDILTTYKPSTRLEFSASAGVATIPNPAIGGTTTSEFMTVSVNKKFSRNIVASASYSESTQSAVNADSLAAALGDILQSNYSFSILSPIGQKTTMTLSYQLSSIETIQLLQRPDNTTFSLRLDYRF